MEATKQSNKALDSILQFMVAVGKSIGDELALLATAVSGVQTQQTPYRDMQNVGVLLKPPTTDPLTTDPPTTDHLPITHRPTSHLSTDPLTDYNQNTEDQIQNMFFTF